MKSQSVNPSVGSGDGDALTDSFNNGVIHAVRVECSLSERSVYNNPLDMWSKKAMEFQYLARVARRLLAFPATQAQSDCMFSIAGLTVNKRLSLIHI